MSHIDFADSEIEAASSASSAFPAASAPDLNASAAEETGSNAGAHLPEHVLRIRVDVEIILGQLRMPLAEVVGLREGAILPLDRKLGEWVDIAVNGRLVARGEVVALDDEPDRLGVVIRELTRANDGARGR
jgi:flagellar motor switch protein FliN/FliY